MLHPQHLTQPVFRRKSLENEHRAELRQARNGLRWAAPEQIELLVPKSRDVTVVERLPRDAVSADDGREALTLGVPHIEDCFAQRVGGPKPIEPRCRRPPLAAIADTATPVCKNSRRLGMGCPRVSSRRTLILRKAPLTSDNSAPAICACVCDSNSLQQRTSRRRTFHG